MPPGKWGGEAKDYTGRFLHTSNTGQEEANGTFSPRLTLWRLVIFFISCSCESSLISDFRNFLAKFRAYRSSSSQPVHVCVFESMRQGHVVRRPDLQALTIATAKPADDMLYKKPVSRNPEKIMIVCVNFRNESEDTAWEIDGNARVIEVMSKSLNTMNNGRASEMSVRRYSTAHVKQLACPLCWRVIIEESQSH